MKLIVPDCHIEPNQDLTRFDLLGKLIVDRSPTHIIFLGDTFSVNSLNHWNAGKPRQMEGQRYKADCEAGIEALQRTFAPLAEYQQQQRRNKVKLYKPQTIFLEGNHEFWITRQVDAFPSMEGFLDVRKNFQLDSFFDIFVPFKQGIKIGEITYTHAPLNRAGQPLSGMHISYKTSQRYSGSCIFGHYHRWESFSDHHCDSNAPRRFLSAGCFFDDTPGYIADTTANPAIWSGITLINDEPSVFETEQISLETLRKLYD